MTGHPGIDCNSKENPSSVRPLCRFPCPIFPDQIFARARPPMFINVCFSLVRKYVLNDFYVVNGTSLRLRKRVRFAGMCGSFAKRGGETRKDSRMNVGRFEMRTCPTEPIGAATVVKTSDTALVFFSFNFSSN